MERAQTFKEYVAGMSRKGCLNKVRNSWGIYDVYKSIRKHHWYNIGRPVTEKEFYSIIRSVNKLLAEEIALGHTVKLPQKMGKLELRKYEVGVKMKDGKLKITYPVDWAETLKLWYEDAEAEKQKILLRNENPFVYWVRYCTEGTHCKYPNKYFYQFALNTFVKKALSRNIKAGKVDTAWS